MRPAPPFRAWFPALVVALLAFACSKPKPNVVIVVLDTARPDALSVYGAPRPTSPFLEEFAKAWGCREGDEMVRKQELRARIW